MRIAVITGGHGFDVIGFHDLFRSLSGIDAYVQPLEDWATDRAGRGTRYDALVFYNMHTMAPEQAPGGQHTRAAIDDLSFGEEGIVVLHHGILAFNQDPVWDDIVGLTDRTVDGVSHDESLHVCVADADHPITRGLDDFDITDETYDFRDVEGADSHVLLTVDHANSMSTQAWTRRHGEARVFNLVLGHDGQAWGHEMFRTVLLRGIGWAGGATD